MREDSAASPKNSQLLLRSPQFVRALHFVVGQTLRQCGVTVTGIPSFALNAERRRWRNALLRGQ
ncbi:MAG: hypothetical protein JWN85_3484 [Gammaproteobacteria bacterium]|nr:hypothetical protein [Gammaproteobacteria bacterium]